MNNETKKISREVYEAWRDQPILHDEDQWGGKYKTVGEMWEGEGYAVEQGPEMCEKSAPTKRVVHPRNPHVFEEYDLEQLAQANKLLLKVYEYHYGDSHMRKELSRLETIIKKLEALQNINKTVPVSPRGKEGGKEYGA